MKNRSNKYFLKFLAAIFLLFSGCHQNNIELKIEKYSSGTLKSIKKYSNGTLDGESVWFHPNGNIESKVIYRDGKEDGHAQYFYSSGALKSHRFWVNG